MEYKGVISGIGDAENNVIFPEMDADIYNFIIGGSGIVSGMSMNGLDMSSGMCLLAGYRGVIKQAVHFTGNDFIYGKFVINFDETIPDEFYVFEASSDYPETTAPITEAGTYYLLLYLWDGTQYVRYDPLGELNVPSISYPQNAAFSDNSTNLLSSGVISPMAKATTAPVNSHQDQDAKFYPATTEYVHNQIEEELNEGQYTGNFVYANGNTIGTYTLKRRAKYVIGTADCKYYPPSGSYAQIWATFPAGYKPKNPFYFSIYVRDNQGTIVARYFMYCNTNGEVSRAIEVAGDAPLSDFTTTFGYEAI